MQHASKLAAPVPSRCRMQPGRLLQRGSLHCRTLLLRHSAHPCRLAAARPQQLRCLASVSGGSGDRSWGEILSGAAELGTAVASKLSKTVKDAAGSIMPSSKQQSDESARSTRVMREDPPHIQLRTAVRDAFGGGLTGKVFGSLVGRAFGGMMETMQESMEAARSVQEEAAYAIRNDPEVQRRLGGAVQVDVPFSQEQSTTSVNGRTTQQVRLRMPVVGPRGTAEAIVEQRGDDRQIHVKLPEGGRISVGSGNDGNGRYGGGRVIDVEAEDVR